jgi:hypothetical protein
MRTTSRSGRNNETACGEQPSASQILRCWTGKAMIVLNHFSAAAVFALFASIVFGITHRDTTREMVRYGLYCFAMFLGGALVAGWAMWVLRR